jgi:hypothetical protein
VLDKIWDINPSVGGPIARDKVWFYATYRYWGVNKTTANSFFDADPSPVPLFAGPHAPGHRRRPHPQHRRAHLGAGLRQGQALLLPRRSEQGARHWGIAANIPPDASAIQATPTSFVSVSKWTRTHSNKLLFDGGFGVYDQEYQENYQPEVFAGAQPLVTLLDQSTNVNNSAWNNPADHFSKLFTEQFAATYVTGSHSLRMGAVISQAKWRLVQQYTRDVQPVTYNGILPNGNLNPVSVTLRIPTDRRNSIKNDSGVFAQDRWTINRATINAGIRWDWFMSSVDPESLPAGSFNQATTYDKCPDGKNNLNANCVGRVTNWKDINPRIGLSYDLFGNGRTAIKASAARYVNGVGLRAAASPTTTIRRRRSACRTCGRGATSTTTDRRSTAPARCSPASCRHLPPLRTSAATSRARR